MELLVNKENVKDSYLYLIINKEVENINCLLQRSVCNPYQVFS